MTLVGCSGGKGGGGFSARAGDRAAGTLNLALSVAPTTLDPAKVQDVETAPVLMHVFETLVDYDETSKIAPKLAASWTVSPDGRTYTFKLAEAKFSNGKPFTSRDVARSFERALAPSLASPVAATYLGDIVGAKERADGKTAKLGVEAPDDRTVVIRLTRPFGAFLGKLTYPSAAIVDVDATGPDELRDIKRAVGTGPFTMKAIEPDRQVELAPAATYRGPAPKLAGIRYTVVKDGVTRLNRFRQGSLDLLTLDRADIPGVRNDPALKSDLTFVERPAVYYLLFNGRAYPPFKNLAVRRAFAMAVDRARLARDVLGSLDPAERWVPPAILPRKPAASLPAFDPAAARAELARAGIKPEALPPLDLALRSDNADARAVGEALASDLAKNLGLKVRPRAMDWGALLKARNRAELGCAYLNWTADYVDPENFLSALLASDAGVNFDRWSDPDFDRLCRAGDTATDPAARDAAYSQAEAIVLRQLPRLPLYFGRDALLVAPRVKGLRTNALGVMIHTATSVP